MLNYLLLIIVSAVGMAALDNDPTSVSLEEWAIYGVMLFACWKLVQRMIEALKETGEL